MDPWKIATAGFATLSGVLFVALVVVWTSASTMPEPIDGLTVSADPEPDRATTSSASVDDIEPDQVTPRGLGGSMPVIRPVVQGEAPSWATNPSEPLPDDVMERAREQLRADFESRRDERRDEVRDEIDAFLDDEGIDSATAGKVHDLLDQFGAKMDGMREQMRSGEVDRGELRMKFREEREALDAALNDALGTETADRLRDRMPGPGPRGGPMRPGGGGGRGGGL